MAVKRSSRAERCFVRCRSRPVVKASVAAGNNAMISLDELQAQHRLRRLKAKRRSTRGRLKRSPRMTKHRQPSSARARRFEQSAGGATTASRLGITTNRYRGNFPTQQGLADLPGLAGPARMRCRLSEGGGRHPSLGKTHDDGVCGEHPTATSIRAITAIPGAGCRARAACGCRRNDSLAWGTRPGGSVIRRLRSAAFAAIKDLPAVAERRRLEAFSWKLDTVGLFAQDSDLPKEFRR